MSRPDQIIQIHLQAAAKPLPGAPCNGCGVCCLMEPCPLGQLLSGRQHGACRALRWHPDAMQYCCGAITVPAEVLEDCLPRILRFLTPWLARVLSRLARRWVAAGIGCDCDAQASPTDLPGL